MVLPTQLSIFLTPVAIRGLDYCCPIDYALHDNRKILICQVEI